MSDEKDKKDKQFIPRAEQQREKHKKQRKLTDYVVTSAGGTLKEKIKEDRKNRREPVREKREPVREESGMRRYYKGGKV